MKSDIGKRWLAFFRIGVAILLLAFLFGTIGIKTVIETFKDIRIETSIIVGFCLVILFIIGALNVWLLLRTLHSIKFISFLNIYSYSWAASLITPGQAGDATLIVFLKRYGIPLRSTGITYLIDKILTVGVFFGIAWYGSYKLIPELNRIWFPMLILGVMSIILIYAFIKFTPKRPQILKKVRSYIDEILSELDVIRKKWYVLILNIFITVMKWLVITICYFMAFLSFNAHVKWPEIAVIPILSTLVGYIPISIGGIGTVELTATHLFSKVGVEQSIVLSAYLLLRTLQYVIAGIMISFSWRSKVDSDMKL